MTPRSPTCLGACGLLFLLICAGCSTATPSGILMPLPDSTMIAGSLRLTDSAGRRHFAPEGAIIRGGMVRFMGTDLKPDSIPARRVVRVDYVAANVGGNAAGGMIALLAGFAILIIASGGMGPGIQ